jgi:hypothetical protein
VGCFWGGEEGKIKGKGKGKGKGEGEDFTLKYVSIA